MKESDLGRCLFKKRGHPGALVLPILLISGLLLFAGLWSFDPPDPDIWQMHPGELIAASTAGVMILLLLFTSLGSSIGPTLIAYEQGVQLRERFKMVTISYRSVVEMQRGGDYGTASTRVFALTTEDGCRVTYGDPLRGLFWPMKTDEDLQWLYGTLARHLAERLRGRLRAGEEVQWSPSRLSRDVLKVEHRPFVGRARRLEIPWQEVELVDDALNAEIRRRGGTQTFTVPWHGRDFDAGLWLVRELIDPRNDLSAAGRRLKATDV